MKAGKETLTAYVILGDRDAPNYVLDEVKGWRISEIKGKKDGNLKSIKVQYPKSTEQGAFLKPFAFMNWDWDAGWLITYLAAYIPIMFFFKWLLKIP